MCSYTLDIVYVKVSLVLLLCVICHEAFYDIAAFIYFFMVILVKTLTFVSSLVIYLISSSSF